MRLSARLLRTQAFRIVLVYAALFAFSVAALLFFTYWNTRRVLDAQTDQTIQAEITGLNEQYQHLGLQGLYQTVVNRTQHAGQALYLLADHQHHIYAGNLDAWPTITDSGASSIEFDYVPFGSSQTHRARGKLFAVLPSNYMLLVAQDLHDRDVIQRMFTTTLPWTVGAILLLGLAGGGLLSRNMLRKLDDINRISGEIIAGNLNLRIPVSSAHDEFDAMAENLNRMLDRVERLMKGMREVTDSVAHDLRTPLNRLRNRLEESLARLHASGQSAAEIESAIAETDKLIATFNALLLIAETDAGTARGAMALLDLGPVAADICELYEPFAEEKQVRLNLLKAGEAMIEGNRSLISQALANLVDNAIKYTPPGGMVTVRSASGPAHVDLVVADSGPGIPAADRGRVTERFVRLEASRNSPGTGLGLSLVASVAHFHGAQLLLEDNGPGLRAILRFPKPVMRPVAARPPQNPSRAAAE
jgi:signal transduction histidine kinase